MIQLEGVDERSLKLTLFVFGKHRDEVGELTLEHQRQKSHRTELSCGRPSSDPIRTSRLSPSVSR